MTWLSLEIRPAEVKLGRREKNPVRILISKRVAKLATRRNRLRRLLKEELRLGYLPEKGKLYIFKVLKDPGETGLAGMRKAMNELRLPRR